VISRSLRQLDLQPRQAALVALALIVPAATFAFLLKVPRADLELGSPTSHFYIVTAVAALALILAVSVIWASRKLPDARTFFLAMGFFSMATIFFAHGVGTSPLFAVHTHGATASATTLAEPANEYAAPPIDDVYGSTEPPPGYGLATPEEHTGHVAAAPDPSLATTIARGQVVGYSAQLSLVVSAIFFALATIDLPALLAQFIVRRWFWCVGLVSLPLVGHVFVALEAPTLISWIPLGSDGVKWGVASIAVSCLVFAGVRFFQSYRLAQLPMQGAMAIGMAYLIEAQVYMIEGRLWHLSWWGYHLAMLAGFLVCVVALLRQYRVTGDLGAVVEGLFLRKQVSGLRAGDPRALVALSAAVAAKDSETAEHIERVGELTVAIGRRLELPETRMDLLRLAGRLHDVGKIGVPNNILRKPGPLTPEEFETIKLHTTRGFRLADRSELLAEVAPIIRAHHEKLDGSGYPDGLRGEFIPFEARIVSVADVWDALTCDRPYRKAMEVEQAASIMESTAGPHLDPRCVQALFEELGIPYGKVPYLRRAA
jgi:HD-GYP domain-containing protein (c-di-GMP phosphodiesterase class II)